eukprot:TRINITY_DN23245_c0_g1_i1.p1 TRINITY_DN23245_c0_g1~~TRINITY_DN23245_c0_g1_i1.p1  ORF type:complete len:418 (-),score=40.53 TRINITY_DN23245_c0_g1_i1:232-1428(-)
MAAAEPLLPPVEKRTRWIFVVVGLATSIVWNQVMLSVGVLVLLYGEPALARAASVQNVACALSMVLWTMSPSISLRIRIMLAALANAGMVVLSLLLALGILWSIPFHVFLLLVAANGFCTGTAQSLGASLSGSFEGAAAALLLGESCAPPITVAINVLWMLAAVQNSRTAAAAAFCTVEVVLFAAIVLLWRLSQTPPTAFGSDCDTTGSCQRAGGLARDYTLRRLSELVRNALVASTACMIWVSILCSAPFISAGLCAGDEHCTASTPALMLSSANFAAFGGRMLGMRFQGAKTGTFGLTVLFLEALLLMFLGFGAVWLVIERPPAKLLAQPTFAAVSGSVFFTLWCNFLLMRNHHSAQASCGHSIAAPCPITSQIMWLSIQVGFILGTFMAGLWVDS